MQPSLAESPGLFSSRAYLGTAEIVFHRPRVPYPWDDVVMCAVGQNTFRGFHKVNKQWPGAKQVFTDYFRHERRRLITELSSVRNEPELHQVCNRVCQELQQPLGNIKPSQLKSYNKVRKPVDLYIEHSVAMCSDFNGIRDALIPFLFLPLDSQILADPGLFADRELAAHRLSRWSTYQDITSEKMYVALQHLLVQKAAAISNESNRIFCRIYFDLLWNDRYLKPPSPLFAIE